jgi:hypothetical protein
MRGTLLETAALHVRIHPAADHATYEQLFEVVLAMSCEAIFLTVDNIIISIHISEAK